MEVFIHSSIKTRIETEIYPFRKIVSALFLYIVPLKQGLKPLYGVAELSLWIRFLYIVPLKQGLKHACPDMTGIARKRFLYIVPLKQGLKRNYRWSNLQTDERFLYIVPLKQGLKPTAYLQSRVKLYSVFIHSSIKTRIETRHIYPG